MPSDRHKHGIYGLFDLAPIDLAGTTAEISPETFEARLLEQIAVNGRPR